ncbi:MAG: SWIM zinc finger family protein [Fimbriimonadales bacterium]|nr:SWIM zinc finger family protein [Fimbriimonadales bacterium]
MQPMTLDEVRALCDISAYHNAEQIVAADQLLHLARSDDTLYAQVQGSKPYTVRIEFKGDAPRAKCTCPAARFAKFCKHAIAVLIVWAQSPERFTYGQQTLVEEPPAQPKRGGKRAAKATVERTDLQTQSIEQTLKIVQELAERGLSGVQPAFLNQLKSLAPNLESLKARRLKQALERLVQLIENSRVNPVSEEQYTRALLRLWLTARALEEHFTERRALPDEQMEEMLGRTWRDKDLQPRENLRLLELAYENIELPTGFRLDISHLMDLDAGELLREMKIALLNTPSAEAKAFKPPRAEPILAPRVGVYPGYAPKRIKIYDALPLHAPTAELIAQAVAHAHAEWQPLIGAYLQRLLDPFAPRELPCLVRYQRIVWQDGAAWLADTHGALLPLALETMPARLRDHEEQQRALQEMREMDEFAILFAPPTPRASGIPFETALMRHTWLALFGYLEGEDEVRFRPLTALHETGVVKLVWGMQVRI